MLLFETGLPTRCYPPEGDIRLERLRPGRHRSHCPYKGVADRLWDLPDHPDGAALAWSYGQPYPAVAAVAGRIAFYDELVDVTLDGVRQQRPRSPSTEEAHRAVAQPPG